jgi:hypothetical protein
MTEVVEHALAIVTLTVPSLLVLAHALLSIARRLHAYAESTPSTADDKVTGAILAAALWLDVIAKAIAHAASMGVLARKDGGR